MILFHLVEIRLNFLSVLEQLLPPLVKSPVEHGEEFKSFVGEDGLASLGRGDGEVYAVREGHGDGLACVYPRLLSKVIVRGKAASGLALMCGNGNGAVEYDWTRISSVGNVGIKGADLRNPLNSVNRCHVAIRAFISSNTTTWKRQIYVSQNMRYSEASLTDQALPA